ncbi:MAG: hypothetical protein U0X76_03880 [Bacteroidia bacterium]
MNKLILFLASAILLFVITAFITAEQNIYVEQVVPQHVEPGNDFIVTLTVHKGNQTGFARLQQFLPAGCKAEAISTEKAEFINDEGSAKFIWVSLPTAESFTVSYKVIPGPEVRGRQVINGLFYYIAEEKTQKISLDPAEFFVSLSKADGSSEANVPGVERKLFSIAPDKGQYRVELTIHPNNANTSAQFIDQIPDGYTAESIDTHGATFSFENRNATFTWLTFPADSVFTISYMVSSGSATEAPVINGMLVYGDDSLNTEEKRRAEILAEDNTSDSIIDALIDAENAKEVMSQAHKEMNQADESATASTTAEIQLPAPQAGIYYKVQICATRKSPARKSEFFHKKYNVADDVELTYHEGWKKYIIGSFTTYEEAKAYYQQTREKVSDAFIVAYDNGTRVPVAEARSKKAGNN